MEKPKKPINYLNNKDILKEIHASKNTYCYFTDPEYHRYDYIVDMPESSIEDSLNHALMQIENAKEVRAARISQETGTKILAADVPNEDLIFRVMTWDHIPLSQKQPRKVTKKKTAKDIFVFDEDEIDDFLELEDPASKNDVDDMVHVKVNFPPFQHYKLDVEGNWQCVGKSHWKDGIDNGYFSKDHGNITNKLARMYMKLCEKYSMKYNWRGYSYRDEMEASAILQLTYVGLRFNEVKSSNPFAYYTAAIKNSFRRVLNTEKRVQNIRDDILEMNNLSPSMSRQMKEMTVEAEPAKTTNT